MNPHSPKITAKKKKQVPLDELLDQIDRLKMDIERIQSGYELYRQLRSQTLGKYFEEWRAIILKQMQALDHLHQHPDANKGLQRDISAEFKTIFHHFEDHFTWSEEEIAKWTRIVRYHTGISLETEELPVVQEEEPTIEENVSKSTKTEVAERKNIKGIYKELMKFYHPDRNPDPNAINIAQEITVSFQEGDLDRLLAVYQKTFHSVNELEGQDLLRKKLEQELELLLIQYDEMVRQLGADQNITEKSAKKRVKAEGNQMKAFIAYQKELLQLVYCDIDFFKQYIKQR